MTAARVPVLLLGEDPGSRTHGDDRFALYPYPQGCSGWYLCRLFGLSRADYLAMFYRQNLYATRPVVWSKPDARARAIEVLQGVAGRVEHVVAVGSRVRDAVRPLTASYGHQRGSPWGWFDARVVAVPPPFGEPDAPAVAMTATPVPHPSGLNRWYNHDANRDLAERRLRGIVRGFAHEED